jgi:carboxyl-terminal processing protease
MIRTSRALAIGAFIVLMVGVLAFASGVVAALNWGSSFPLVATLGTTNAAQRTTPAELQANFRVFWEAWNLVERKYYRRSEIDQDEMVYGSIEGMLRSLNDPYTVFERPETAAATRERMSGQFEGIGAYIEYGDGQLLIVSPIEGSPAEQAGIMAGDQVLQVDGQELAPLLEGLTAEEASRKAASLIRGPKGTTVDLTLYRASTNETLELTITRGSVPLISVHDRMLEGNIAYVQISEFKETTTAELDQALHELLAQNPSGLILDVRNNPGGLLLTAREVLGRFVPDRVALYEEFGDGSLETINTVYTGGAPRVQNIPTVVLINQGSASAAEIVAGALRDHQRATLVGERTFGKGSVQVIQRLSDESSVRITIANWLTPNKDEIHLEGIDPQFYVPLLQEEQYRVELPQRRPEEPESVNDAQLWWALQLLTTDEQPSFPTPIPTVVGDAVHPSPTVTVRP